MEALEEEKLTLEEEKIMLEEDKVALEERMQDLNTQLIAAKVSNGCCCVQWLGGETFWEMFFILMLA